MTDTTTTKKLAELPSEQTLENWRETATRLRTMRGFLPVNAAKMLEDAYLLVTEIAALSSSTSVPADAQTERKPLIAKRGETLGGDYDDWPEWCTSFRERLAYQQGVADSRALAKASTPEPVALTMPNGWRIERLKEGAFAKVTAPEGGYMILDGRSANQRESYMHSFVEAVLAASQPANVLDLDKALWEQLCQAAKESKWIPQEYYYANDWVNDLCGWLRDGPPAPVEAQAVPEGMRQRWFAAYTAFQGVFDTPVARHKDDSEFAQDARRRLREFNESMLAAQGEA